MGGGIPQADHTEFTECLRTAWENPYIIRLAFSAGIGGLLFGYDTGVVSGALIYIREDFKQVDQKTRMQEIIASMAIAGAIVGSGVGGWINDKFGRKKAILIADMHFLVGSLVMAFSLNPWMIIAGRIPVGLGVGMTSVNCSSLYFRSIALQDQRCPGVGCLGSLEFLPFFSLC